MTTIGGIERSEDSYKYRIPLIDCEGKIRIIVAYGIEKITNEISNINTGHMNKLFNQANMPQMRRPSGTVDLLIGFEYAAWHPTREQAAGHLLLLSNIFGKCMGGYHPRLNEQTKCGGCRCGKCAVGSNNYTLKEERELALIKDNLKFVDDHWEAIYPWVKDPKGLPDNKYVAMKKLFQTEDRLIKNEKRKIVYIK